MKSALQFIERKGYKDDEDNSLYIIDSDGDTYNPVNGEKKKIE